MITAFEHSQNAVIAYSKPLIVILLHDASKNPDLHDDIEINNISPMNQRATPDSMSFLIKINVVTISNAM